MGRPQSVRGARGDGAFGEQCRTSLSSTIVGNRVSIMKALAVMSGFDDEVREDST